MKYVPVAPSGARRPITFDLVRTARFVKFALAHRSGIRSSAIVYSMGKVGSSTVVASLREHEPKLHIYHVHYITEAGLGGRESFYRHGYKQIGHVPQHLVEGRYVRHLMRRGKQDRRWSVVTLVRDPVACNISRFFQTLSVQHPDIRIEDCNLDGWVDAVVTRFITAHNHRLTLDWLDVELGRALKIDPYAKPFDQERGYQTYAGPYTDILIIRLEDLNRVGPYALSTFLGLPSRITLSAENAALGKSYADAYGAVKRSIAKHTDYLEEMYTSKFARHFYTAGERAALRRRWTESAGPTG